MTTISRPRLASRIVPVLVVLLASACLSADARAQADNTTILSAVRFLMRDVLPADTSYRHKDPSVKWAQDGTAPEAHADCSGLVNAVLKRVAKIDDAGLARWLGRGRPVARDYHDAIVAGRGFRHLDTVFDLKPGDVIAIRFEAAARDTGHVMIADSGATRREPTAPVVEGTTQWEVAVIDSTASPHGRADTRFAEDGKHRTGIGRGKIRLYTDAEGKPVGYAWSTGRKSKYRAISERPVALGRVTPGETPPWTAASALTPAADETRTDAEPAKEDDEEAL